MNPRPPNGKAPVVVLIVDDSAAMRRALRALFAIRHPEASLVEAENGSAALASCMARPPDIVLLDVGLPDGDGIALLTRLKAVLPPHAVVIVTSLESGPGEAERARAVGAHAFVEKEVLYTDLDAAITRAYATAARDRIESRY